MQTFLPYSDYVQSAKCLDRQRLGKQRLEALTLAKTILFGGGWRNHPAVKMWENNIGSLLDYGLIICNEWMKRGYKSNIQNDLFALRKHVISHEPPAWLGGPIHASHRSNLLRKNYEFYSKLGWTEPNNLPYHWPKGK